MVGKAGELEEGRYFFDSYAVIEVLKENPNYNKFKEYPVIISIFNLSEIYWFLINDTELESNADIIYSYFKRGLVEIGDGTLKEAIKFRKEHKKKNLSYADCIGYIYAKNYKMKFLTGDKEFSDFENVEFVK